jgi:hypothetical protein
MPVNERFDFMSVYYLEQRSAVLLVFFLITVSSMHACLMRALFAQLQHA